MLDSSCWTLSAKNEDQHLGRLSMSTFIEMLTVSSKNCFILPLNYIFGLWVWAVECQNFPRYLKQRSVLCLCDLIGLGQHSNSNKGKHFAFVMLKFLLPHKRNIRSFIVCLRSLILFFQFTRRHSSSHRRRLWLLCNLLLPPVISAHLDICFTNMGGGAESGNFDYSRGNAEKGSNFGRILAMLLFSAKIRGARSQLRFSNIFPSFLFWYFDGGISEQFLFWSSNNSKCFNDG